MTAAAAVRVLVVDPLADDALRTLRERYEVTVRQSPDEEEFRALAADAEVIVLRSGASITRRVLDGAPNLRVIARAGVGVDNIELAAASKAGVTVFNVPGSSAPAVAELALGLVFALGRHIALADRQLRRGQWRKAELAGVLLRGRTLGVLGLGAVGGELARGAVALGMDVIGSLGKPTARRRAEFAAQGIEVRSNEDVLAGADVVALALPLNERTRGLVGAAELKTMRPGAYLVNVSRAAVVNEDQLYDALQAGVLGGAALDVFENESRFAALDNVVLTPHIGAMATDVQAEIGRVLVDQLANALAGAPVENRLC